MKVACVIQARLGSTRLPAKVLLPLPTGRTVLEEVIWRCKQIKGVDIVVVAIPDTAENDQLADVASGADVVIIRGREHDVLSRYVEAADAVNADAIMRITADCPLIDHEVCAFVLSEFMRCGADYATNTQRRSYPQGFDCQIASRYMLNWAHENAVEAYDREHVFPILERLSSPGFNAINVSSSPDRSHIRWTLDTAEDYEAIRAEFERREREAA